MASPVMPFIPTPAGLTGDDVTRWQTYVKQVMDAYVASTGIQKKQIEAQLANAEQGLKNAMEIAKLQSDTSRYGTDIQRETRLTELRQNQAQFEQTHALDMQRFGLDQQKFGLDVAKTYSEYASTPDLTFQRGDLMEGLDRVGQGLGPSPYGSTGQPQQKTWADFAALSGYNTPAVQANQSTQQVGAGGGAASAQGGGAQQEKDPRQQAAMGILKAIPMSDEDGMDDSDFAALNAIRNVITARRPGTLQKFRPGQRSAFFSGAKKLGLYAPDLEADMIRGGIGQGNARSA